MGPAKELELIMMHDERTAFGWINVITQRRAAVLHAHFHSSISQTPPRGLDAAVTMIMKATKAWRPLL
jgi:hypothetical protein